MAKNKRFQKRMVATMLTPILNTACRVGDAELKSLPLEGPLIVATNHINFLELPMLYTRMPYELLAGFSKVENWDSPFLSWLFNVYETIPLNRDELDVSAFRSGLDALKENKIVMIAPEGTRSHHGRMQEGKAGVVFLALRSKAPILPIAHYGGENFQQNLKRLKRTPFNIVVGNPFHVDTHGLKVTHEIRQQITTELMYQLAVLLPPEYRGVYSDLSAATDEFLRFEDPEKNNLLRAKE